MLVLGRDIEADKGCGVIREYGLDDAFKIYLAGVLIDDFGIGLKETQQHVGNIALFLQSERLLPSYYLDNKEGQAVKLTIYSGSSYKIEWLLDKSQVKLIDKYGNNINGFDLISDTMFNSYFEVTRHYRAKFFPANIPAHIRGPQWVLDLTTYLNCFLKQCRSGWTGDIF